MEIHLHLCEHCLLLMLNKLSTLVKRKIYQEKELDENRTRAKNARHLEDGRIFQVDVYNLDVIIVVGYRVNSKK